MCHEVEGSGSGVVPGGTVTTMRYGTGSTPQISRSISRRIRRQVRIIALMLGVLALSIQSGFCEPTSLTIGAILPLSGSAASFGQTARVAMELALEDLPSEERKRITVLFEDDGLVPSRSVSAGRKLMEVDKVDALVTWSSSTALSLVSVTEERKLPHIAVASDPAVPRGRRYTFTYWALPEDEAQTLYSYLVARGLRKLAILAVTHNGLLANRTALERLISERGELSIVASEEVPDTTLDFRAVIGRMKAKGSFDAFIPIFFPGQLAPAVKQVREAGIDAPIVGFETFEDAQEIAASQGRFSGVVFATGADPSAEFMRKFQRKLPGGSLYTASNCYDAIAILIAAFRGGRSGDEVSAFLRSLKDYRTASGIVSATEDNRFRLPTTLKKVDTNKVIIPVEGIAEQAQGHES